MRRATLLLWLGLAGAYLLLPTRNYNGDGLALLQRIANTQWWENFDPNHFLFVPLAELVLTLASPLVGEDPLASLWLLQFLNGLVGLAALWTLWRWMGELAWRDSTRLVVTGLIGFAFTPWYYATNVDIYALLFLTMARGAWHAWRGDAVKSGLWAVFALLTHQIAILAMLPMWAWLAKPKAIGLHLLLLALLVGGPYLYVSEVLYRDTPYGGIQNYLFDVSASGGSEDWASQKFAGDPVRWARTGTVGHWNLFGWSSDEELYYALRGVSPIGHHPRLELGLAVLWLLLTLFVVLRRPTGRDGLIALIWLGLGFEFTCFLNPGWAYYRLTYLIPLALLLGWWIEADPEKRWKPAANVAAALLMWNLPWIVSQSAFGHVPNYAAAVALRDDLTREDLVIVDTQDNPLAIQYLRAITGVQRMVLHPARVAWPAFEMQPFERVDETTLGLYYDRVFVSGAIAHRMDAGEDIVVPILLPTTYERREIHLDWKWYPSERTLTFGDLQLVELEKDTGGFRYMGDA